VAGAVFGGERVAAGTKKINGKKNNYSSKELSLKDNSLLPVQKQNP
jgi:hypothetical protein